MSNSALSGLEVLPVEGDGAKTVAPFPLDVLVAASVALTGFVAVLGAGAGCFCGLFLEDSADLPEALVSVAGLGAGVSDLAEVFFEADSFWVGADCLVWVAGLLPVAAGVVFLGEALGALRAFAVAGLAVAGLAVAGLAVTDLAV